MGADGFPYICLMGNNITTDYKVVNTESNLTDSVYISNYRGVQDKEYLHTVYNLSF
jgi:hypothetical protein